MPIPHNFIPGHGPLNPPIALIGEQPGKQEVIRRECFVGPAGKELNDILRMARIPRTSCYLTNVIKDLNRPLKSYIEFEKNRTIVTPAGQEYIDFLKKELEYVKPIVAVAIGNVALYALTSRRGITKWRGSILESTLVKGLKVIPCIHPATVIPPKNKYLNKHLILNDLVRSREETGTPEICNTPRTVLIQPSYYQCLEYLEKVKDAGRRGQIIDFDIEMVRFKLSCLSFALSDVNSICIPFTNGFDDYFTLDQEEVIMREVAEILEDPSISIRGQNISFDIFFMAYEYGIITDGDIHDTMISQKITMPDYPAGLDFVTSIHTDIPYYKADGKKYLKIGGDILNFWQYNGLDTISTAAGHPGQVEDLVRQNNIPTYDRQRKIIKPLVYMSLRGIKVDLEGMKQGRKDAQDKVTELEAEIKSIVGYDLNWNSPQQLQDHFYKKCNEKPYMKRNSKGEYVPTTDADALKRLIRKGYKEAGLIQQLRNLKNKVIGTYLDPEKVDADGRYRSSYNPGGASTGRISSSENIVTESGGNQQNIPHSLLRYFIADDDCVIYGMDLSQVENRIVAYVGRVLSMIEAFEKGIDLHALTAALIFEKAITDVTSDDYTCDLGDGTHSERFWGKKANHGLNYDLGFKSFALKYEMKETDGKWIVNKYHKAYPEVRSGYHGYVKSCLQKNRTLTNLMGRNRVFLDDWGDSLFKTAYAQIPQSTTADVINERGLNFCYYNQQWFKDLILTTQIHDAIFFQVPLSVPWSKHAEMILRIKQSLETPLEIHGRKFVVPCDLAMGINMCKEDMKEWKSRKIPSNSDALGRMLMEGYNEVVKTIR